MYTTGDLFAPSYDILNIVAECKTLGSVISVTTDEVVHGLQVCAKRFTQQCGTRMIRRVSSLRA